MAQPTSTRLQPITALRAMRSLQRSREDTRQAVLLIDALRGRTSLRQFARFRQTETGRAVLAERRQLLDRLSDRECLAALPPGTLGRSYHEFMATENLTAEGLVEASRIRDTLPLSDDYTVFRERSRETHDLLHIVTGYGRDPLGEGCVLAFSFAQSGLKGFAVIAFIVARRISRRLRGQPVRRAVFEAYRHGRRAGWLYGADWENLLAEPVEAIRARYRVAPATHYPKVLAAARAAKARLVPAAA
jgi:ubiquinone biosynthesis protein COQ4